MNQLLTQICLNIILLASCGDEAFFNHIILFFVIKLIQYFTQFQELQAKNKSQLLIILSEPEIKPKFIRQNKLFWQWSRECYHMFNNIKFQRILTMFSIWCTNALACCTLDVLLYMQTVARYTLPTESAWGKLPAVRLLSIIWPLRKGMLLGGPQLEGCRWNRHLWTKPETQSDRQRWGCHSCSQIYLSDLQKTKYEKRFSLMFSDSVAVLQKTKFEKRFSLMLSIKFSEQICVGFQTNYALFVTNIKHAWYFKLLWQHCVTNTYKWNTLSKTVFAEV